MLYWRWAMLPRANGVRLLYPRASCLSSCSFLSLWGRRGLPFRIGFCLSSFCCRSSYFLIESIYFLKYLQSIVTGKLSKFKVHYFRGFFKEVALFNSYLLYIFKPMFSFFIISYLWWVLKIRYALLSKLERRTFNYSSIFLYFDYNYVFFYFKNWFSKRIDWFWSNDIDFSL